MFRIAVIINENEVAHSKYADTVSTLSNAMNRCSDNGKKTNSYIFITFDRFNIHTLFEHGEDYISSFNGIVVATNALHNSEIFDVFCTKKKYLEEFINENKGIFISSQKKLSNERLDSPPDEKKTGFMPDLFDYYLFDRPEKSSKEGAIKIFPENTKHKILTQPYQITEEIITNHCEHNQFIVHRYRSIIIPKNIDSYISLLHDESQISNDSLGYKEGDRKLLLVSRYDKRIVISTMALDWANHSELLANIITFIAEDKSPIVFVKKKTQQTNNIIDSYIIRTNASNLPYRVINESPFYNTEIGSTLIFSSDWKTREIEKIYKSMLKDVDTYFSIYHICSTTTSSTMKLSKYCNFSSIDVMKDVVIQNLVSGYLKTKWNKSVWTYYYIINLIKLFSNNFPEVIKEVYLELSKHFTKNGHLTGDYDGVFNATCMMVEILSCLEEKYDKRLFEVPYSIDRVITVSNKWLVNRIEGNAVFDQDICYYLLYLFKNDLYDSFDITFRQRLIEQFRVLIAIDEPHTPKFENQPSIDLCRIYQTLCLIPEQVVFNNKESYLQQIEIILRNRQDNYGNWKNINETAEIAGMLLSVYGDRLKINKNIDTLNIIITKAVEVLYGQFNTKTNMWNNDLNTTAKAMFAIGLYNNQFNFSINDFFNDLNDKTKNIASDCINNEDLNNLYQEINESKKNEKKLNIELIKSKRTLNSIRNLSLFLWALFFSILFITVLIFIILLVGYYDILLAIIKKWAEYFISGFFSLVVAAIGTSIYIYLRNKIRK